MPTKRSKPKTEKTNAQQRKRSNPGRSNASTNPFRKAPGKDPKDIKGAPSNFRTGNTIKRLNMYNDKPDMDAMKKQKVGPARIEPDRKWYGNVRTIDQKNLEKFRVEMAMHSNDPYQVLQKAKKLPISLVKEPEGKKNTVSILDFEKFQDTFGKKATRTRAKLMDYSIEGLANLANEKEEKYDLDDDTNLKKESNLDQRVECGDELDLKDMARDKRLEAGQSRRIWEELYKVLDSSDVVVMVLDARNPMGTRSKHVENHLKHNCPYKHLVFVLNKVDLVPTSVTKAWIKILSEEYPTIAYK